MSHFQTTWQTLYQPGDVVEVRAFLKESGKHKAWDGWTGGLVYGYFDNESDFVTSVTALDNSARAEAIYITLNPVRSDLLARAVNRLVGGGKNTPTATDNDIVERRWLLLDFDPKRPAGISATNDELKDAYALSEQCRAYLADAGWPEPVIAASGNGIHHLYRVNLPNDDECRDLLRDVLKALAARFDGTVTLDAKVFNAARITKAYGSKTAKGDNTEERPHRRSSIARIPDSIQPVSVFALDSLAQEARLLTAKQHLEAVRTGKWTPERLLSEALEKAADGSRNDTGLWLACQLRDQGYSEGEAENTLRDYAARVPNASTYSEREALSSVAQAYKEAPREPRAEYTERGDDDHYDGFGDCPEESLDLSINPATHKAYPYLEEDGRIYVYPPPSSKSKFPIPVANFIAHITQEIEGEDGMKLFVIEGNALRGNPFKVEVEAEAFGEDRRLRSILEAAAGALDGTYASQSKHLAPAIKLLSSEVKRIQRFERTGWQNGHFLFPGRPLNGYDLTLPSKLPYGPLAGADLAQGDNALRYLLDAIEPEKSTVVLAALLSAPLAALAGWRNERYAVFIAGRTGSFKTSWAQVAMSLYGAFGKDELLIKWGEGATRNAIMSLASSAADLPMLIDNYKPQTGGGERDFVNLIHNIVEGGEKDRLNRSAQLKAPRPVFAWPVVTGEDVPDSDAASLARVLVVEFNRVEPGINMPLTNAQGHAHHLNAVGMDWIGWLESAAGRQTVTDIAANLSSVRVRWAQRIFEVNAKAQNPMRIATNLATNELGWQIACQRYSVLTDYTDAHRRGLESIAEAMAHRTADSLEAERFLVALRELVATRQVLLLERELPVTELDRDRVVGWFDGSGVYLLPETTIRAVKELLGPLAMNSLSQRTLISQLRSGGWIVGDEAPRQMRMGGSRHRIIHLHPGALETQEIEWEGV
jgi:hypothetical protein